MPNWKTRNDPNKPGVFGQHYQEEKSPYGAKARRKASGSDIVPRNRSVDSMKAPVSGKSGKVVVKTPGRSTELSIKPMPVAAIVPTQEVNEDRVQHFQEAIKRGETLPPILVHRLPNGKMEVIDGHHRLEAYRREGIKEIPVVENGLADIGRTLAKGAHTVYSRTKEYARSTGEGIEESRDVARERRFNYLVKLANSPNRFTRKRGIALIRQEFPEELEEVQHHQTAA